MHPLDLPDPWPSTEAEALVIEEELRARLDLDSEGPARVDLVAGLDAAYHTGSDLMVGAVTILDATTLDVVAEASAVTRASFPYVPGLLAFREVPALAEAMAGLPDGIEPDLIVCDGYGVAHPRRFGLACHVGVLAGVPSIGVGKTPFIGDYDPPGPSRGAWSPLTDGDEVIGRVLRTQGDVKEVFVSVGHAVSLETACRYALELSPRYRLPETTRAADQASRRALKAALINLSTS
jgi:deoxyribonuclease V